MDYLSYIEVNPKKMLGKPVLKGTRITVEIILEKFAAGETMEDILNAYPQLNHEHIFAVFAYAARSVNTEATYPTAV